MQPLNQRDPRWARQQLGTSNTTIGSHGCTITCIAMLVDTTPDVVNRELKRVGGFAQGNLVIWSKIPVAFPQLIFIKRVNSYNNDDVKANLPCLVEVDFDGSPNTFGNHWVVFIGNQRLLDPWVGQNRPTSTYKILKGYAVLTPKKKEDNIVSTGPETTTSEIPQTPLSEAVIEPTPTPETPKVEEPTGGETPVENIQDNIPVGGLSYNGSSSNNVFVESGNDTNLGVRPSITRFDIFISQTLAKIWNVLVRFLKRF